VATELLPKNPRPPTSRRTFHSVSEAPVNVRPPYRLTSIVRMPSIIRLVLFAALFIYSAAASRMNADELTDSPPPLPLAVGEHIAADLINMIFLFDRMASDPPRAATPNYLARVSDPSSPLYRDYMISRLNYDLDWTQ